MKKRRCEFVTTFLRIPPGAMDMICCYVGHNIAILCKQMQWLNRYHTDRILKARLLLLNPLCIIPIERRIQDLLCKYKWNQIRLIRDFLTSHTWEGSPANLHMLYVLATYANSRTLMIKLDSRIGCYTVYFVAQADYRVACFVQRPDVPRESSVFHIQNLVCILDSNGMVSTTRGMTHLCPQIYTFIHQAVTGDFVGVFQKNALQTRLCYRCRRATIYKLRHADKNPGLGATCYKKFVREVHKVFMICRPLSPMNFNSSILERYA